jgi:hypothetical protein
MPGSVVLYYLPVYPQLASLAAYERYRLELSRKPGVHTTTGQAHGTV